VVEGNNIILKLNKVWRNIMKIGFIGLGRMGASMAERLVQSKHQVFAYDVSEKARQGASERGAQIVESLHALIEKLPIPHIIWIMVPAGKPTDETIRSLTPLLSEGDIIIDGGNSFYKDSVKRGEELKKRGIFFLDAGTSGGIWGLKIGYCLMVGGEESAFRVVEPIFQSLAPKDGYAHVGKNGAGHFVKMVHNGIEYALLQAYAEGFELMEAKKGFDLDLARIAHLWNQGSVIRSWLLELGENVFARDAHLSQIKGYVEDSGEGRWSVDAAIEADVPAPLITLSLIERLRSRQQESFSAKVIAALRHEFGGHTIKD
jgi:6-phosphogluconate dehydrogenase